MANKKIDPKKKKLTPKQKKFVNAIVEWKTGTQAALEAYDTDEYFTAASIAHENLKKPQISSALDELADKAKTILDQVLDKQMINNVLKVWSKEVIDVAKYVHDKVNGKATQKIEQETTEHKIDYKTATMEELLAYLKKK